MDKPIPEAVLAWLVMYGDRVTGWTDIATKDLVNLAEGERLVPVIAAQQQGQAVACPYCGGTGGHWEGCRAPVDIQPMQQGGGEVRIPSAAEWCDENAAEATMEWRAGWDACRVEYPRTAPPSAPVGVEGLPQPFGYVEPRHDLSGYEVFDEPGPRRAAIWNMHGMRKALAQTRAPYSIDTDADGVRARVADAITGALAFGAQGTHKPPAGHWLEPFWDMARADAAPPSAPMVDEATARRLDDYLGGEFDIRIGKQAAHAALCHALAQQPAAVDEAMVERACVAHFNGMYQGGNGSGTAFTWESAPESLKAKPRQAMRAALTAAVATQHQEPTT